MGTRRRPRALAPLLAFSLGSAVAQPASAPVDEGMRNWYHDPFFRISGEVDDCPEPAGPFVTQESARRQEHHRAEAGTTCWLAGRCRLPNSYAYDAGIGKQLKAAFSGSALVHATSLWVTVQARVAYIQGCAADESLAARLEALARTVPDVELAVAAIDADPARKPPYRTRRPWSAGR